MKKKLNLITFIILLNAFLSFSQKNVTTGYIEYEMTFPNVGNPSEELGTLIFNDSISLFTYRKEGYNKKLNSSSNYNENENGNMVIKAKKEDKFGSIIFRNFRNKNITFRLVTSKFYTSKLVKDNWVNFNWEIKNKYKKIGTFNCQMAEGKFRGRIYTAWFTNEIALSYGPWKLFGLPGLIIEASDEDNDFKAKLRYIKYPKLISKEQFKQPTNGEKLTIKEFATFQKNIPKIAEEKIKSKFPRGIKMKFSKLKTNFIEKTFEWETEKEKN
ncbi:MAG: GLPGLI family protein [Flavobacteriaceae bacterium]|nr:MAG: GLPGLI family protein [Flavobacteriaceae bacterium]